MTRDLQALLESQTTLAHRVRGQLDRRIGRFKNAGYCGIPGHQGRDNAEPAAKLNPGQATSRRATCEPPNRQGQEGKSQEAENGNKGAAQPECSQEHQGSEDRPTQKKDTNSFVD